MFKIIQWDHSSIYGNTLHTRRKGKSETNQQDYAYINIPSDKIRKLYQAKGCKYSKIKRVCNYQPKVIYCSYQIYTL
jgi:hypothetical protein